METPNESDPLLQSNSSETRIYPQRWYIVGVFALFGCLQSCVWSIYGPMDLAIQAAYGWPSSSFAMMTNWGNIFFILTIIPSSWILEKKGLKSAVLLCSLFSALSMIIRVFNTKSIQRFTISSHIGSILNGISGTTILSAPSVLSSTWFPPNERTIATSISQMFNLFGNALSFMLGPRIVSDIGVNATDPSKTPETVKERIRDDVFYYFLYILIAEIIVFVSVLVYYPSRPKFPPSTSSSISRVDFVSGVVKLLKNKTAWFIGFAYSIMIGFQSAWNGIQSLDYNSIGILDKEAGNIGLVSTVSSCVFGLLFGYLADRIRRKYRVLIVFLLLLSSVNFIWFFLIINKVIPISSYVQIYISNALGIGASVATLPLYFEYASEILYPISEGEIGAFLTIGSNVIASVFCFCVLSLALIKDQYRRSEMDEESESRQEEED
ncbi:DIRC2 [Lepeophtheirus salmonis]|uniref:DIRC2 n=2 Tax=Lepeophtheirus salmonis TaxID=72036 RepID=A0A7R8CD91_LEPSM|nr:DIRC2 [Lepeophtheirus salmonis]CAF2777051.1 DIRC2 [Lepeophtheirus salmonis]